MLFIANNPFSTLRKIWKNSGASKNWEDVRSDLYYLTKQNLIKKAHCGGKQIYFVPQHLEPSERITANHLLLKDEIFSLIESNEQIRTKNKINSQKLSSEKILEKLVSLYFLKVRILLLEYNKNKKFGDKFAIHRKELRELDLVNFLLNFKEFLSRRDKEPYFNSRVFASYKDLSDYLDEIVDTDTNYHTVLSKNKILTKERLKTYISQSLETKKGASEKFDRTMKQISNRIRPLQKSNGEPDYEKMSRLEMNESGYGILDTPEYTVRLINIENAKKVIKEMPKGKRRDKLIKDTWYLYPEIILD